MKSKNNLKSEDAERKFWSSHDSTDQIDWSKARKMVFPNLRPSYKTISIRLSTSMIEELRLIAHKKDVPYQSLLKMYVSDGLGKDLVIAESKGRKTK